MFRSAILALSFLLPVSVQAETVKVLTEKTVDEAAAAMEAAIETAGATLFARIDHGAGARSVGQDIGESRLLIFGTPKVGTPAMLEQRALGLALPLKVLVYEDTSGAVWLAYEAPEDRLAALAGAPLPNAVTAPMTGALNKLTTTAAQ